MPMAGKESIGRARILVVDQEDWCRQFLSSIIKLCGFEEFKLTNSVAEALVALDEATYDLVITDLKQPDYQRLLDNARTRHPATRFIVMMQRTQTHQMVYLEQVDIVYKPLSMDEIIRKIRHALHQKQLRQAEEELKRLKQTALRIFLS
jgi:DNA-binding NtrC family response regulator